MRLLHYVEIENFKRFGETQHIELDHPAVLIGPNNCGKTSAIQAIALWSMGLKTWRTETENSKAETRTGKALNRMSILQVPVPRTRHFWHDLKVSDKKVRITVGVDQGGRPVPVTMIFRHHQSDELVYCEPAPESLEQPAALEAAAKLDVSILYPMSGIAADEAVILPTRIDYHLGRGSTAEVVRNLCLLVAKRSAGDWGKVTELMRRLFHVELSQPVENERGAVDLSYTQVGAKGDLDLSLAGRGFQQVLLIFAHLFSHQRSVLLIDEPDAHLEVLRQRQIFVLLRDIAHQNNCQVVMVTHSEVVLGEALDTNLTLILDGKADDLAKKRDIHDALKHFGAENYVRARETGHVLYVEGSTDVDMLKGFARRLEHPVSALLEEESRLNVYYLQDNFPGPDRSTDEELERVEGGFGMPARDHFKALCGMLPGLRGLALYDHDGHARREVTAGGLSELQWRRYEPENYFVTTELLESWVSSKLGPQGLFATARTIVLTELLGERIFVENPDDLETYLRADAPTRKALWRAQTQHLKLSAFAEEYFRRIATATATPMLLRKGSLHEMIDMCDPADLNGDVREKLDALLDLLK